MNKFTNSEEETILFAENFARNLKSGDVVLLSGELGSGKTTFIKGIARAIGIDQDEIKSPSFVIMNLYEGRIPLYHFDLYRLENNEDINDLGFEEFFE